jgi:hypothetical protein
MYYYTELSLFQVETASSQFHFAEQQQAVDEYQKLVTQEIPCELYKDGQMKMKYNPQ